MIHIRDLESSARHCRLAQHKGRKAIASRIVGDAVTSAAGRGFLTTQRDPSVKVEAPLGAVGKAKELRLSFVKRHVVSVDTKAQVCLPLITLRLATY